MSRFVMSKTPWEYCVYPVLKEALEKTNYNQTELAFRELFGECEGRR